MAFTTEEKKHLIEVVTAALKGHFDVDPNGPTLSEAEIRRFVRRAAVTECAEEFSEERQIWETEDLGLVHSHLGPRPRTPIIDTFAENRTMIIEVADEPAAGAGPSSVTVPTASDLATMPKWELDQLAREALSGADVMRPSRGTIGSPFWRGWAPKDDS